VAIGLGVLAENVTPIVEGLGFRVVELNTAVVSGRTHVTLVIYSAAGVGIDECAIVHRTVLPRLEVLMNDRDVALQVASPGIDRVLKDWHEFEIFTGRGVRILSRGQEEWTSGVVQKAGDQEVELAGPSGVTTVRYAEIQKAKLDYTQEVR
jgi:ribosome maturation factor RimP